jgi:hypothetical protein
MVALAASGGQRLEPAGDLLKGARDARRRIENAGRGVALKLADRVLT